MDKRFKTLAVLFVLIIVSGFSATPAMSIGLPIWTDNFEGDWSACWHTDAGTWEVGTPTSGPGGAYNGTNSAATILAGNYPNYVDSRLIRNCPFVVPSADQNPALRFWHWYYFTINDSDFGQVQIRAVGDTDWTTLATYQNHSGFLWTKPYIPLSDYAGQTVEIAFRFYSDNATPQDGWYIDDVSLEVGPRIFTSPEDWESGLDDWHVDYGNWDIGSPTSGPGSAHGGANCVATRLDGVYSNYVDSRLISPPFTVPAATEDPAFRFWHWYYFTINDSDFGQVQIRAVGDTNWTTLATYQNHSGYIWTQSYIPLSDYAGQTVEIAFRFYSDNATPQDGWYIDDVSLEVGPRIFTSPEDWESGLDDWHVDYGNWDIGSPTSGPGSAHGGANCAATRLDGVYINYVASRLISPPFFVCPSVANPVLRFWHWYYFTINDNDFGQVQIRAVGDTDWTTLATYQNHSGFLWTQPYIPLSDYAGQTVEIAFYFYSDNATQQDGWYIDDIELQGLTPVIGYAPFSKYTPDACPAQISSNAYDPCGTDLFYNWNVPEGCTLIGVGPTVEVECPDIGPEPNPVTLSVESETSFIRSQNRIINILTQVEHDANSDGDIDGSDLHNFANSFSADELARFALEYGLVGVSCP